MCLRPSSRWALIFEAFMEYPLVFLVPWDDINVTYSHYFTSHFYGKFNDLLNVTNSVRIRCCCVVTKSCPTLCNAVDYSPCISQGFPWDFPGKNTRVGYHFLLQGIFPTQGSEPCLLWLLQGQAVSLALHHQGSPRIRLCLLFSYYRPKALSTWHFF